MRKYRKRYEFDESELRLVRQWKIAVVSCYGMILAAMVAIAVLSQTVGNWVAVAAQSEMRDHMRSTGEQTQLTMSKH